MVAYYNIAGRQVGSHVLAMATLAGLFGVSYAAGGGSGKKTTTPPINAQSSDEESFIKEFLKNAEAEEKKAKK